MIIERTWVRMLYPETDDRTFRVDGNEQGGLYRYSGNSDCHFSKMDVVIQGDSDDEGDRVKLLTERSFSGMTVSVPSLKSEVSICQCRKVSSHVRV